MITTIEFDETRAARANLSDPIGFVPTMGFLHEGHLSLVRKARQECASVVVSIFVNPTQFSPSEDLAAYPRDISHDLDLLKTEGVDLVWLPTPGMMYPPNYQTWVTVESLTQVLEGAWRPGHFRGVTTVVTKLFNTLQPHIAYFGQKDAQQAIVIQQMVRDLNFSLDIKICPIVREDDGLAMSSRNVYLDQEERRAATVLSRALIAAKKAYEEGENNAEHLRQIIINTIHSEPLAKLHYASIASPTTLAEIEEVKGDALFSMAVNIGNTRLIDNFLLRDHHWMTGQLKEHSIEKDHYVTKQK